MKNLKVIISGGGTGGHIYPALAIAQGLKLQFPGMKFLFVGAKGKMEMEKIPKAGFSITGLWISGFYRGQLFRNLLFPLKLVASLFHSFFILIKFRPKTVIGTGGFASGPILYMASLFGIPTLIQEQNSFPGITNKLLSTKVNAICVAYEGLSNFFPKNKIKMTGNPVRQDLLDLSAKTDQAKNFFGLQTKHKTVLVLGGSLGARRINELIEEKLNYFKANQLQVIWQCGRLYYEEYKRYENPPEVCVRPFINRMDHAYAAADFMISRAGASSVSELCVVGKPVVFIPSPNVAEDHQTKNAESISKKEAAILIKEAALELEFEHEFSKLLDSESLRKKLKSNIKKLAKINATEAIVAEIETLLST